MNMLKECHLQAADTSVAAREHAARVGTQLYSQAADQAAVARDQAAQALGEGIDRVRRRSSASQGCHAPAAAHMRSACCDTDLLMICTGFGKSACSRGCIHAVSDMQIACVASFSVVPP